MTTVIRGADFRATTTFVTDPTGFDCPVHAGSPAIYPTAMAPGGNFGWDASTGVNLRDRLNTNDPRLAGIQFGVTTTAIRTFKIDLPNGAGTYDIGVAMGDEAGTETGNQIEVFDGATSLGVLITNATSTANHYFDATGALLTEAAWASSNATVSKTFTGTTASFKLGGGTTGNWSLACIYVSQTSGGSTVSGAGEADGAAAVAGVGHELFSVAGSTAGKAAVAGASAAHKASAGSSAGKATVAGASHGLFKGAGAAAGHATVSGVGSSGGVSPGAGAASGHTTVAGVSAATKKSPGAAAGHTTVAGVGHELFHVAGAAAGHTIVAGVGQAAGTMGAGHAAGRASAFSIPPSTGVISGRATVSGMGNALYAAFGEAFGVCLVDGATSRLEPTIHTVGLTGTMTTVVSGVGSTTPLNLVGSI